MTSAEKNKRLSEFSETEKGKGLRVLVSTSIIEVREGWNMASGVPKKLFLTKVKDHKAKLRSATGEEANHGQDQMAFVSETEGRQAYKQTACVLFRTEMPRFVCA